MKSVIYLTPTTSATASMWRIITAMLPENTPAYGLAQFRVGKKMIVDLEDNNNAYMLNTLTIFPDIPQPNSFKWIINLRDPRDRLCNIFYWKQQHPNEDIKNKEDFKRRADAVRDLGIDEWVLKNIDLSYYDNLFRTLKSLDIGSYEVLSYARLCLSFDSFVEKCRNFLEVNITSDQLNKIYLEQTDNNNHLKNPNWIGHQWFGTDTLPGRYKRELKEETQIKLSNAYRPVLLLMSKYDPDFAYTYQ